MDDLNEIATRSLHRVWERLDPECPWRGADGQVYCPFCYHEDAIARELVVRRTVLGQLDETADGERPHIDGVQLKCAGEGCALRPDFDVPLVAGHGHWPELNHREEFEHELDRRDDERVVDLGYTPDVGRSVSERLQHLGYLR